MFSIYLRQQNWSVIFPTNGRLPIFSYLKKNKLFPSDVSLISFYSDWPHPLKLSMETKNNQYDMDGFIGMTAWRVKQVKCEVSLVWLLHSSCPLTKFLRYPVAPVKQTKSHRSHRNFSGQNIRSLQFHKLFKALCHEYSLLWYLMIKTHLLDKQLLLLSA